MRRSRVLAVMLGLATAAALVAPRIDAAESTARAALTLDTLMARFRAMPGLSAEFREEKRIALLAEPLVSTGTVHYAPPRRFARHTLTPSPASVVLDGETLRFSGAAAGTAMDISHNVVASAFVDGFLGVLAGDRAAMERNFVIDFHASDGAHSGDTWDLELTPKVDAVKKILRTIHFKGDGTIVREMRILEASGDEGITTFQDVDTSHRYSPEESLRVFRLMPGK